MKNQLMTVPESSVLNVLNSAARSGSGAAATIAAGAVLKLGGAGALFAISVAGAAASAAHVVNTTGRYTVPKQSTTTYAAGQKVGYDFTNDYVTNDVSNGVMGEVTRAAVSADTTVEINLNGSAGGVARDQFVRTLTNVTGNQDFDVGFPVAGAYIMVDCRATDGSLRAVTNVIRNPGGSAPNTVRLTIGSLALTDVISLNVVRVTT